MREQPESGATRRQTPRGTLTDPHALERRVAHHLACKPPAEPVALVHLEVAGAWDVKDAAGRDAISALRGAVAAILTDHLGEGLPLSANGLCGFTFLLEGCDRQRAVEVVRELKQAVESMHFAWDGHPFSLSIDAGILELGPDQTPARRWLARAQEACSAAQELSGEGITVVAFNDHAWRDIASSREWVRHLTEIIS